MSSVPMLSIPLNYRPGFEHLPPTALIAFRFYRRNDIVLYTPGCVYEGDLVEPARWAHLPAGTRVFVRLWGGLETAPIVGALILSNKLNNWQTTADRWAVADDSGCSASTSTPTDRRARSPPTVNWCTGTARSFKPFSCTGSALLRRAPSVIYHAS
jgi:hypothetical protein